MVRIYTQSVSLPKKTVLDALESQLGVVVRRSQQYGSSHVDAELSDEDAEKVAHATIRVGKEKFRIGPTFPRNENVVAVILEGTSDYSAERVREAFRDALGQGATYLAATRGSSMQEVPDICDRVYLRMDPAVRMRDVVPRRIEVDGEYTYVYWYHSGPVCRRCGRGGHPHGRCNSAPPQPRGRGPARPASERAARGSNSQNTTSSGIPTASAASAPATEGRGPPAHTTPRAQPEAETRASTATSHDEAPCPPANAHAPPEDTEGETAAEARDESGPAPETAPTTRDDERPAHQAAAGGPTPQERATEARSTTTEADPHAQRGDEPRGDAAGDGGARAKPTHTRAGPGNATHEKTAMATGRATRPTINTPSAARSQLLAAQPITRRLQRRQRPLLCVIAMRAELAAGKAAAAATDDASVARKEQTAPKAAFGSTRPRSTSTHQ